MIRATACSLFLLLGLASFAPASYAGDKSAETMSSLRREQSQKMLQDIRDKVAKEYYDSTYHGFDFEGRYKEAVQKIQKATSVSDAM